MKHSIQTANKLSDTLMLLCSCAFMLLCSSTSVSAAELPETAKLIPPETILLVDIDNFNQLQTQFEKTSLYNLYKDPSMAAFVDNFKTKWQEQKQQTDKEFIRIIADAGALPQGRAAVAFVPDEQIKDVNEPPVLLIVEWGEKIDKVLTKFKEIAEAAKKALAA